MITSLLFFSVLLGCSSTSKLKNKSLPKSAKSSERGSQPARTESTPLPPEMKISSALDPLSVDLFYERKAKENHHLGTRWWALYRRAKLWEKKRPEISCSFYLQLAQEPEFPINDLATLRAASFCPTKTLKNANLEPPTEEKAKDWLKPLVLDIEIKRALRDKNNKKLVELYTQKSKKNLPVHEKLEYTQKALKLAKKLGLKKDARYLQKRIYKIAPRFLPRPRRRDYLKVAYDFRRVRDFKSAKKYYHKLIRSRRTSPWVKVQAYRGLRSTLRIQRNLSESVKVSRRLGAFLNDFFKGKYKKKKHAKFYHDNRLIVARTIWTDGRVSEARKVLQWTAKKVWRYHHLGEIHWLLGRMDEEKGEFEKAVEWFEKGLKQDIDGDLDLKEKLLWYAAWNYRKIQNWEKASEKLNRLLAESENSFAKQKYRFWLAKTENQRGQIEKARKLFAKLKSEDPMGYYGLLAHRELNKPLARPQNWIANNNSSLIQRHVASSNWPGSIRKTFNEPYVRWMISVGETEVAKNYLDGLSKIYRKHNEQDPEVWFEIFSFYAKAGQYLGLFIQLGRLDPNTREQLVAKHPDIVFPKPFAEQVAQASRRFGLAPEFIYAIMRQESAFNPKARSHMDAMGLMQLLPKVAKVTAKKWAIPYKAAKDLYEPHINVALGASHLRDLWDKYNSQMILAVAAYNANERAIRGWIRTRYRGDALEFIEDIPYEETKGYVKLVTRNLIFYRLLTSRENTIPFPEWTVALPHLASN